MTEPSSQRVKDIFLRVSEAYVSEQERLLHEECGDNAGLRAEVESLLRHSRLASPQFLDPPTDAAESVDFARSASLPELAAGTRIAEYRIIKLLGEGGMGMVYQAEHPPTGRLVAVKVIKPGMDTRTVIQRFQFERRTLALLSHPNIAAVLDMGAMEGGRPYFVMELVQGSPITEFCHANRCSVRERVALLAQVARGIAHAHAQGVLHRDLKASNVLVVKSNAGFTAKIIDFGIARLLSANSTACWTAEGHLLGTPEFMSPEQILGTGAVDVRSDIYSLGVLLYFLLTDSLPVNPEQLRDLGPTEMHRLMSSTQLAAPSSRVEEPDLLRKIRGELDWVTLKAMQKDPDLRYATAAEMAADLQFWLDGKPVTAGPTTAWRQLCATMRRHRLLFSCIAAVGLVVLSAFVVVTVAWMQTREAQRAEADARIQAEAINDFVQREMLAAAAPEALGLNAPVQMVLHDAIMRFDNIFASRSRVEAGVRSMLGETLINCRRPDLAVMHWQKAGKLATESFGASHDMTLRAQAGLARAWTELGRLQESRALLETTLGKAQQDLPPEHDLMIRIRCQLGHTLAMSGEERGFAMLEVANKMRREHFGAEHPELHQGMRLLAQALEQAQRLVQAISVWQDLVTLLTEELGQDHPSTLAAVHDLGRSLVAAGQHAKALPWLRRVLAARSAALGERHPNAQLSRKRLIEALQAAGLEKEAAQERGRLQGSGR